MAWWGPVTQGRAMLLPSPSCTGLWPSTRLSSLDVQRAKAAIKLRPPSISPANTTLCKRKKTREEIFLVRFPSPGPCWLDIYISPWTVIWGSPLKSWIGKEVNVHEKEEWWLNGIYLYVRWYFWPLKHHRRAHWAAISSKHSACLGLVPL